MSMDATQFRQILGTFATGCTVVTMGGDSLHGLTANAFSSVSADPPLVLVCVDHDTTSYELLSSGEVEGFCVNILSKDQRDLAEHFADMTELEANPFDARVGEDRDTHAPVFEDDLAYLDCDLYDDYRAGDHTIYLGEVRDGDVLDTGAEPLAFYQGGWGTVTLDD